MNQALDIVSHLLYFEFDLKKDGGTHANLDGCTSIVKFDSSQDNELPVNFSDSSKKQYKLKTNVDHGSNLALVLIFEASVLNFIDKYKLICAFLSTSFKCLFAGY